MSNFTLSIITILLAIIIHQLSSILEELKKKK